MTQTLWINHDQQASTILDNKKKPFTPEIKKFIANNKTALETDGQIVVKKIGQNHLAILPDSISPHYVSNILFYEMQTHIT